MNYKRLSLIFIFLPFLAFHKFFYNIYYLPISIFISMLIITFNFTSLLESLYTRPLYIDDLDKNTNTKKKIIYNIEQSGKFRKRFIIYQQFILSITISLLIEYIILKYDEKQYSIIEFLGFIGGLLSLYVKFIRITGKILLHLLYKIKNKQRDKILKNIELN